MKVVKPCKDLQTIVFDFHGTISLNTGSEGEYQIENDTLVPVYKEFSRTYKINTLKKYLRRLKEKGKSWYDSLVKSKISPEYVVPTYKELISFTETIKKWYPHIVFVVASNQENEEFIRDILRYVYEREEKESPFRLDYIISTNKLYKYKEYVNRADMRKMQHISILKHLWKEHKNSELQNNSIVLIDNSEKDIKSVGNTICTVYVEDFFTIKDWNMSIRKCNEVLWMCVNLLL